MTTISLARHLFPPAIIRHTVWLYLRFSLSYRDVEDLLAERGLDVSYESVRRWVLKFGPLFARELRCKRHRPTSQWHLDEMAAQRVEELGALAVEPQEVVLGLTESADGCVGLQATVWPMPVVAMEPVVQLGGSLI